MDKVAIYKAFSPVVFSHHSVVLDLVESFRGGSDIDIGV